MQIKKDRLKRQNGRLAALVLDSGYVPGQIQGTATQLCWRLFLTSFDLLFFELICIRWIPAYVRYLGYFTNFILLASFLGIGLGILSSRHNVLIPRFPILLFLLVCIVGFSRFEVHILSAQVLYYGASEAAKPENRLVVPVIFVLVAIACAQLARPLGPLLTVLSPLEAYAVNVVGSLAGTAAFFVMSYYSVPPLIWFLLLASTFLFLCPARESVAMLSPLLGTLVVVFLLGENSLWSPYYRIQVDPDQFGGYMVNVNNIGHQEVGSYLNRETFYFRVYDLLGEQPFKNVLVIGAGTGSDVAIALHKGAGRVDAVEIDPVIYQLGQRLNPDKPYADARVHVYIEDGRAFLRNSHSRYDLIVFGLPDSLTLTSGFASLRLESFLLTTDAFKSAREHLTDDGILVLYNYYREDWLVRKLAGMLESVFSTPPYVATYGAWGHAAVLLDGPRLNRLDPLLAVLYEEGTTLSKTSSGRPLPMVGEGLLRGDSQQALATDDWPFVYMPAATLPTIYIAALAMVLAVALVLLWISAPRGTLRGFEWHFFFLGAAFMLLETRSLVAFALLFGATWMVNSLVFFGILCSVLLANLITMRHTLARIWPLYVLLFVSLSLNYFLPSENLLVVAQPAFRYTLASLLAFAPIFLANMVFSHSFRDSPSADIAFASNLLGAMVGGGFEYLALAFGYRFLLVPITVFYVCAFFIQRRS